MGIRSVRYGVGDVGSLLSSAISLAPRLTAGPTCGRRDSAPNGGGMVSLMQCGSCRFVVECKVVDCGFMWVT